MKALIIYDDFTGATRATAALKGAAWRANVSADWDIKPWRTDALKLPSVADKALIEAADADLIVLAGPQAHSLPTWLEQWLNCWVIRRNIADAALAVLYDESGGVLVAPDAPHLSQFAEDHGLRLISENETMLEDQTLSTPRAQSARRRPVFPTSETAGPVLIPTSYRDLGISN
jgi:hypothetical protein